MDFHDVRHASNANLSNIVYLIEYVSAQSIASPVSSVVLVEQCEEEVVSS